MIANSQELLVYEVDTSKPHGGGPITAADKLLKKGQSKTYGNFKLTVVDTDSEGLLVNVLKVG